MSLNAINYGNQCEAELINQINRNSAEPLSPGQMSAIFEDIYVEYSKEGQVGGVLISSGGSVGLLNDAFLGENSADNVTRMANKICNYWETFTIPGPAQVLDVVLSVTVNATAQKAALIAAINSYITSDNRSGWVGLYQQIETVVKTIPFVIVEQTVSTGATSTFTRTLT